MITTYLDLLQRTRAQFLTTNRLSTLNGVCRYGHAPNGVGCAVGCHAPAALADRWDVQGGGLDDLTDIHTVFDIPAIGLDLLVKLQGAHDGARDYDEFMRWLEDEIRQEMPCTATTF